MFAGMLPMSLALEKTGASEYISNSLVSGLGSYGPIVLMAGIYFTTSLMTMFISNTVTAVLMAPIALQRALQVGVSPCLLYTSIRFLLRPISMMNLYASIRLLTVTDVLPVY